MRVCGRVGGVVLGALPMVYKVAPSRTDGASGQMSE